jgi:glyoxylase-like metal-dependent hydrolase (beta-lactamase superfamily II)
MATNFAHALSALVVMGALSLSAESIAGLPLHTKKLNAKTVRVWVGDYISSTATVAVATRKGIVVIDTIGNPAIDRELRKVIARELGRSDFKYLINTHEHSDHTLGNGVYADCTIVAHELCQAGMKANTADTPRMLEWYRTNIPIMEAELAKKGADSPEGKKLQEELLFQKLNQGVHASNPKSTFPTQTFGESLTLNLGDTTFELYYVGGMHTASDIDIFVPEHGLLMTGDTMADVWLTDSPGCLASFMVRNGTRHDFPRLLKNWDTLLAKKAQIKELIPGHWNGTLSLKGFENRCAYIKTLWEGINQSVKEGKPVQSLFRDFPLRTKFPELVNSPGLTAQNHFSTLLGIWSEITQTESAANKIFELLNAENSEVKNHAKTIQQILADSAKKPAKFYFLENEFNALGYQLIQSRKIDQAVVMFKANAELHPQSWNAFDSLGEAYLNAGDTAKAIANFEKSLVLNPENKNGKDMLARLRSATPPASMPRP